VAYRAMHEFLSAGKPCPCLGGLLDFIGLDQNLGDVFATAILVFAAAVSVAGWVTLAKERNNRCSDDASEIHR